MRLGTYLASGGGCFQHAWSLQRLGNLMKGLRRVDTGEMMVVLPAQDGRAVVSGSQADGRQRAPIVGDGAVRCVVDSDAALSGFSHLHAEGTMHAAHVLLFSDSWPRKAINFVNCMKFCNLAVIVNTTSAIHRAQMRLRARRAASRCR